MRLSILSVVFWCVALGASSDALAEARVPQTTASAMQLSSPRGGFIVMPESMTPVQSNFIAAEGDEPTIIYMNRDGGVYSPGNNDSRTNRSFLPQETSSVPAYNTSDANWEVVMACVQNQFARFNVVVTDVDPEDAPHIESVIGGRSEDIGIVAPGGGVILGVSPFTTTCDSIPNSIVFTFTDPIPGENPQLVCEVAAQEIAHSFGLDHQYLCEDPMSYLTDCGAKTFQNVESSCGEFEERSCAVPGQYDCGYDKQNSVALLTTRLGLAPDQVPPTASIQSPSEGAQVPQGFAVDVNASDDKGLVLATLIIDGKAVDEASAPPYRLSAPGDIAPGLHEVEVVVSDYTNEVSETIQVEVVLGALISSPPPVAGGCQSFSGGQGGNWTLIGGIALGLLAFRRRREKHLL